MLGGAKEIGEINRGRREKERERKREREKKSEEEAKEQRMEIHARPKVGFKRME